ncbi:MAG: hypothetical protein FJ344_04625 [Sphingomonadales bacterium]|nr:hypothetical protein [Sphingomonadales bacterium]
MKTLIRLFLILLVLAIDGYGVWYFLFRPNDSMKGQKADFPVLLANEWVEEFKINEQEANQRYLGQIVEVKGIVREVLRDSLGGMSVILETGDSFMGVNCSMEPGEDAPSQGSDTLVIRGEFSAVTLDVNMTRCVLVSKSK